MQYLLTFLTVCTSIIAVFGDTWNKRKSNIWGRIRPLGWVVIVLTLSLGVCQTWQLYTSQKEVEQVRKATMEDVANGVGEIFQPFLKTYGTIYTNKLIESSSPGAVKDFNVLLNRLFSSVNERDFASQEFVDFLSKLDIRQMSFDATLTGLPVMATEFAEHIKSGLLDLQQTLATYSARLDEKQILALRDLISDTFLKRQVGRARIVLGLITQKATHEPITFLPAPDDEEYQARVFEYQKFIQGIYSVVKLLDGNDVLYK